jgi:hypothetical protein
MLCFCTKALLLDRVMRCVEAGFDILAKCATLQWYCSLAAGEGLSDAAALSGATVSTWFVTCTNISRTAEVTGRAW